jgi:hypothetical protein
MKFLDPFALLIACGIAAGCSTEKHISQTNESIQLTATMPSGYDVKLNWQDASKISAGHIVEYATESNGQYTILGFFPASQNTFTHARLIPDTTFYYRVRPYIGPACSPAEVRLPDSLSDADYTNRYAHPEDYSWGVPQTISAQVATNRKPIKDTQTAPAAAPTGLKAVIAAPTVSGVLLTWTNNDTDAEGYLIEEKVDNSPDYQVCAVVGPGINSFGWSLHPPERKASYRVRAYYFGTTSNIISERTGPESKANYMIPK